MFDELQLIKGARNCVLGYGGVKAGEKVLIWTDRSGKVDDRVVRAIAQAAAEAEAKVTIINEDPPVFRLGESLSPVMEAVLSQVNVVIHIFDLSNLASIDNIYILKYLFDYDVRVIAVKTVTPELLASDWATYPMGLYWELFKMAATQVKDTEFRLTDDNGTDLTGRFKAWPQESGAPSSIGKSGSFSLFPSGNIALHPESPLNGTMAFETMEGFAGILKEPVVLTVKDHYVTDVSGGPEARWLQRRLDKYENARYVCELTWGIHPKAPLSQGLLLTSPDTLVYRHSGTWHAGLGMWPGVGVPSIFHWDGGGIYPNLWIGEEQIIEKGRLKILDSPELWEIAKKYGDPAELLEEVL